MDNDFRGIFAQNRGSKRHGNADGILRFCHGTGFICDELKSFERKNNVRKGISWKRLNMKFMQQLHERVLKR